MQIRGANPSLKNSYLYDRKINILNIMIGTLKNQDVPRRTKVIVPSSKTVALTDEAIIRKEMKAYNEKKEEYLKKYEGKYIALLNGMLLDTDVSISDLATRVYDKVGYRAIFMTLVTRRTKPYRVSSPRFKTNKIV